MSTVSDFLVLTLLMPVGCSEAAPSETSPFATEGQDSSSETLGDQTGTDAGGGDGDGTSGDGDGTSGDGDGTSGDGDGTSGDGDGTGGDGDGTSGDGDGTSGDGDGTSGDGDGTSGDGDGTGCLGVTDSADSGPGTLRAAVAIANSTTGPDTICIPAGTFMLTSGRLELTDDVGIRGAGARLTTVDGGGIDTVFVISNGASAELSELTISGGAGTSFDGGGVSVDSGNVTIRRSTIDRNTAGFGAGVRLGSASSSARIYDSTFSRNSAFGSALESQQGTASVENCTFAANIGSGGVLRLSNGGSFRVRNSTIANNDDTGIYALGGSATVDLVSSIVADNSGLLDLDGAGFSSMGNNLIEAVGGGFVGLSTDVLGSSAGPALDAGANPNALPFDQRGLPRLNGVDVDIGAFER
jgi:hypothetical protein